MKTLCKLVHMNVCTYVNIPCSTVDDIHEIVVTRMHITATC